MEWARDQLRDQRGDQRSAGFAEEVLLVTRRSALVEQVRRLAAAGGVPLRVVPDAATAGAAWRDASAVLLGDDAAALGVLHRRPGVLLVAASAPADAAPLWRCAVEVGAEGVALLPDDAPAVASLLAVAAEGPPGSGRVVGVVGGCGGAGASVLAAAIASTAVAMRTRTLLLDADPLGGGQDVLLGAHDEPGLRWHDLLDAPARLRSAALAAGLPRGPGDVPVLTWAPGPEPRPAPAVAIEAVLDSTVRASDVVVVDLPRGASPSLLWRTDLLVVVVPGHLRAVAATTAQLPTLLGHAGDVRLVVTSPPGAPLLPDDVSDALAVPLLARLHPDRDVRAALGRGEPLPRPRGALARCCRAVLSALGGDALAAPGRSA
ncbi:helicase/secretion neighborhood CpaE-like protein [Quadrisphaera granulorum]|uniref:Secretion/DNA translocation related CpaE-like protein n=1 Tax=Quadrisphaera granulorum TaxID=317664 RepID=A0A316A916_9ACTN|nr:septum site-determining protein Ssd [Quadrisphaera granulorum]PWJ53344.1 secretion/DNA translocation related CpaE-like protein [Quadrisphaera granulorum]SZE97018.1 helicase/secretion neighborhood CpaE-like protein [Quadrisphaera granulorum]